MKINGTLRDLMWLAGSLLFSISLILIADVTAKLYIEMSKYYFHTGKRCTFYDAIMYDMEEVGFAEWCHNNGFEYKPKAKQEI